MDFQSAAYYRSVLNFREIVDDTQDHLCLGKYEQYLWSSDSECAKLWRGLLGATTKSKKSAQWEVYVQGATSKFTAKRKRYMGVNQEQSDDSAYSSGSDDETYFSDANLPTMLNLVFEDKEAKVRIFKAKQHNHIEDSEDTHTMDFNFIFGKDIEEKIMILQAQNLNYVDSEEEDDLYYKPRKHTYRGKIY